MAGGERCELVVRTYSGRGTGETIAVTARGDHYSIGPIRAPDVPVAEVCRHEGDRELRVRR